MSAIPYEPDHEADWDPDQDDDALALPGCPRRHFFNRRSAALIALITCAAGFYAGIRVEKGQLSSSSSSARAFTPPTLGGSSARPSSSGSRSSSARGFPGGGGFPGAALAGGNASIGTISSVDGHTIYLSDSSGNTVKVTLSSATKITKSLSVGKRSLHPGDSVVIRGLKNHNGTVSATSISDSGASNTSTNTSSSSSSSSSTGSSAVNQLFSTGG